MPQFDVTTDGDFGRQLETAFLPLLPASDVAQREIVGDHISADRAHHHTPPLYFVARTHDDIAGYARLHEKVGAADIMSLDVVYLSDGAVPALIGTVTHTTTTLIEWWTRGNTTALAVDIGWYERRRVLRMRLDDMTPNDIAPAGTRAYEPSDAAKVIRINNEAFAGHPDRATMHEHDLAHQLHELHDRHHDLRLLLDDNGETGGFVWLKYHDTDGIGEIYVLALDNAHQHRGYGPQLMEAAIARLRETYAVDSCILYTEADNKHAIAMYERRGFVDAKAPLVMFANRI